MLDFSRTLFQSTPFSSHSPNFMLPLAVRKVPNLPHPLHYRPRHTVWCPGWQLSNGAMWRRKPALGQASIGQASHNREIVFQTWPMLLTTGSPSFSCVSPSHQPFPPLTLSSLTLLASLPDRLRGLPSPSIKPKQQSYSRKKRKESGRSDRGREAAVEAGRLRGMKATTEKSVFSGLVECWPSLRGTWTTLLQQRSR